MDSACICGKEDWELAGNPFEYLLRFRVGPAKRELQVI